jgi:spermidine synthase
LSFRRFSEDRLRKIEGHFPDSALEIGEVSLFIQKAQEGNMCPFGKKEFYYVILFLLFLISGFCGLLYQIIWVRLAFAAFGIITPVLSVVISVFMLGLALGSWIGGKYIGKITEMTGWSAIAFYALIECFIGIGGLMVPQLFSFGQSVLLPAGDFNSFTYLALSAIILGGSILPWCIFMGSTIPLMMAFIKESNRSNTTGFSYLYLANVIGAMCGTAVAAGFLIELVGFHRTSLIAACINFGIAAVALIINFLFLHQRLSQVGEKIDANERMNKGSAAAAEPNFLKVTLLFSTGFVSMAMEVVWTRAFTPLLQTTIYSFAGILIVYLLATWVGSWIYRHHIRKRKTMNLPNIMACLTYFCFLPIVFTDPRLNLISYPLIKGFVRAIPLVSIFPFCAALGYLTPKLIDELSEGNPRVAGKAYAANTVGCILGPLCAAYFLLPTLGVRFSLIVLSFPMIAYLVYYLRKLWAQNYKNAIFATLMTMVLLVSSAGIFLSSEDSVFYRSAVIRRDYAATVISYGEGLKKQLLVNGIGMTRLTTITKFMAHVPLSIRAKKPESALIICLGMGTTFRSAASWGIRATAVELIPSVRDAFGFYFEDAHNILESPNIKIVIDDGRRFLRRTSEKFDIITIDPPPPVESSGSGLLYSEEFYQVLKDRLVEGGIVQQWLPLGDPMTVPAVAKAIHAVFPFVRVYNSFAGWGFHFFASMQPFDLPNVETFVHRLPAKATTDFVEWQVDKNAGALYEKMLKKEVPIESILSPDVNFSVTDDRPINEYFLIRRILQ